MSDEPQQPVGTAEDPTTVTDAGRPRRPSSLRSAPGAAAVGAAPNAASAADADLSQQGKLTAASFPRGKLTATSFPRRGSKPETQPGSKTDPVAREDAGPSPSEKLVTLVSERPEVGLAIAFTAGLVIATILKRLAR